MIDRRPHHELAPSTVRDLHDGASIGATALHNAALSAVTSPAMANEVSFISGVTAGKANGLSFQTWLGDDPATYNTTTSLASKWGPSGTPGTSGGTETYYLDPSVWTPTEISAFTEGLALWSAEANIKFVPVASAAGADLAFERGTDGSAHETSSVTAVSIGSATLNNPVPDASISIDTNVYGWTDLGSFTDAGGYDMDTIVHEEGHFWVWVMRDPTTTARTQRRSNIVRSTINNTASCRISIRMIRRRNFTTRQARHTTVPVTMFRPPLRCWIFSPRRPFMGCRPARHCPANNIFGFHSNIDSSINAFFDFDVNRVPVVTLFDVGTNNTLDLSGFNTPEIVDLLPGTFSSADGLVNNIGIAFNTAIDNFVGGAGGTNVTVNNDSDRISDSGTNNVVDFAGKLADYTLTANGSTLSVTDVHDGITDLLSDVQTLAFSDQTVQTDMACYRGGTSIETASGSTSVERLRIGDEVRTFSGALRPIRWLGRRSFDRQALAANSAAGPILFRSKSLGYGLPLRDLWVSPKHAMYLDGVLIPAECLTNGRTIVRDVSVTRVEYFHIELDTHDVILAEGAPSETFVDDESREMFENAPEYAALYPGIVRQRARFCAPRVEEGYELEAVRRRLQPQSTAA